MTIRTLIGALLGNCALAAYGLAAAAPAAAPVAVTMAAAIAAPPAATARARELAALPGGHWLALDKQSLRLLDAAGGVLAEQPLRGESLDSRPTANGARAVLIDANAQEVRIFDIDGAAGSITAAAAPPAPAFALETLCLYRDRQQLDHLFLIGKDGQAEQWLLTGPAPRLLRRLALPPQAGRCRADDRHGLLYVNEAGLGIWAYAAGGEGVPARTLVAAKPLDRESFAVLPDGLAVLTGSGRQILRFSQRDVRWHAAKPLAVAKAQDVAATAGGLLLRSEAGWRALAIASPKADRPEPDIALVTPRAQTESVARRGDAADDPAIWIHPRDRSLSRVLATNKKQGLLSYDLQGRQQQLLEAGRINNVDLRQHVRLAGREFDLAIATQRDEHALAIFEIDGDGRLRDAGRITTALRDIYGTCLYQPADGGLEVFANDKDGHFVQYRIDYADGAFTGRLLRRFATASQPEGCVADDNSGRLFFGEEDRGIWSMSARADAQGEEARPRLIMPVGPRLVADVEGLALYHGAAASYLVASSQGNSSFVVLDARPPFAYRGAFRVGIDAAAGIDGVSDTDGLEVTAVDLGGPYGAGLVVVQDGYKRLPDGAQNFKYLAWRDIARALGLE